MSRVLYQILDKVKWIVVNSKTFPPRITGKMSQKGKEEETISVQCNPK